MTLEKIILKTKKGLVSGALGLMLVGSPYMIGCGSGNEPDTNNSYNNGGVIYGNSGNDDSDGGQNENDTNNEEIENERDWGRCLESDYICDDFLGEGEPWRKSSYVEQENEYLILNNNQWVELESDEFDDFSGKDFVVDLYFKYQNNPESQFTLSFADSYKDAYIRLRSQHSYFDQSSDQKTYAHQIRCTGIPTSDFIRDWVTVDINYGGMNHLKIESSNNRSSIQIYVNDSFITDGCEIDQYRNLESVSISAFEGENPESVMKIDMIRINPK